MFFIPRKLNSYELNNIIDSRFGRLIVLEYLKSYKTEKDGYYYDYRCKCDCGNELITNRRYLMKGKVQSCGCLSRDKSSENGKKRKKYNIYDLSNSFGIGYTSNTKEPFYFDLEDYNSIKEYCWHKDNNGYIISQKDDKKIKLHRLVLISKENKDFVVDHINHNTLDNRKENLRICTRQQNTMNRICKGVTKRKDTVNDKFRSYITINKKRINLGTFNTYEEAKEKRTIAEILYFEEYRYNHNNKGE